MLLTALSAATAQSPRSVKATKSVTDFRPIGEVRIWTVTYRAKDFGRLVSKIEKQTEVDGREAIAITNMMGINYAKMNTGIQRMTTADGVHYVMPDGRYLGDDLTLGTDNRKEQLHLRMKEDDGQWRAEGYYTRGGERRDESIDLPGPVYSWEPFFVDQLEIWLATHDIREGDTLSDTLFAPQTGSLFHFAATVDTFMYQELWKGRFDSVFIINVTQPQPYLVFFTPDKRLVRIDFLTQSYRVYQDLISQSKNEEQVQPAYTFRTFVNLLPRYVFFLAVAGLILVLVAPRGVGKPVAYLFVVAGAVVYLLVAYGVVPLQTFVIKELQATGGTVYVWWIFPSLIFGIAQEVLKTVTIWISGRWRRGLSLRLWVIGAFIGAGFGLVETVYQTRLAEHVPLFDWSLLEPSFLLVFHIASGALIGWALSVGPARTIRVVIITIIINGVLRYLPVFVLKRVADVGITSLVGVIITLVFLAAVVFILKQETTQRT